MTPVELTGYLDGLLEHGVEASCMIWGAAGIGKSSVVNQVAQKQGLGFIDLRLSQLAPTDLRGLPIPEAGITRWAPPEFLPREGEGVLFLDEINMAPPAMQGVAQQLILDRRIGNYTVPEGWFIWAAGNRKEDRASVFDMPAPLANRFIHLEVEADLDDFRRYALGRGFTPHLIAFLAFRQELLHRHNPTEMAWPSPRSWEMANALERAGLSIEPAVGVVAASEYAAYLEVTENIPDVVAILGGKLTIPFPEEVSLRYATVISLVARCQTAEHAINGLSWLVEGAPPEWVQLYATDLFPLMREKGEMEAIQGHIMQEERLRQFLTDYAQLLAG